MRLPFPLYGILRKTGLILFRDRMDITRLGLIVGSSLWAVFLLLPVQLFPTSAQLAAGKGRATYSLMAAVATEEVWGLLFLLTSVIGAYALFSGVRNRVTLLLDGVLGCILWTGSTAACFAAYWPMHVSFMEAIASYPLPAAMSGELVMAFYSWWHMIRHWAEDPTDQLIATEVKNG